MKLYSDPHYLGMYDPSKWIKEQDDTFTKLIESIIQDKNPNPVYFARLYEQVYQLLAKKNNYATVLFMQPVDIPCHRK